MSEVVTLIAENEVFLSSVPVYVISPKHRKPAHAILNAVSIFSLSTLTGLFLVIFSRMSFVIGKRVAFCCGKSLFPPLIMSAMRAVSKASRLR